MARFDTVENNEIPDLNKCPKCGAFFDGEICPICKTVCPPEMRAGVRKKEKTEYLKPVKGASLTPFYLRWWFILIVSFFSRLAAIVLIWMTPWKSWVKAVVTILLIVALVLLPYFIQVFRLFFVINEPETEDRSQYAGITYSGALYLDADTVYAASSLIGNATGI